MLSGTVTEFSDDRGLGTITTGEGRPYLFHVIEIADGTRTIEVGRPVTFQPLPKFGRMQAAGIRKV